MSASTAALRKLIRDRIKDFTPTTGSTVGTSLSNRLYWDQAPDDVISSGLYPFGVMRLDSFGQPGQDSDVRRLELQLITYPRANQPALEGVADVAEQALLRWLRSNDTDGIVHVISQPSRLTLPPSAAPGEQELVQIVLTAELSVWPNYRTRYAATA